MGSSPLPPMGLIFEKKNGPFILFHKHQTTWERCKLHSVAPKTVEQIVMNTWL